VLGRGKEYAVNALVTGRLGDDFKGK
jgi:hypothetical protein